MKIAVSATGPDLDAEVDPRFGRCAYFAVGDTDTMEFEFIEITGVSGTVKEAVEGYKAGRFQATSGPTASAHSGMGGGTGMGQGMGMGGGMTPPQSLSPEQEMETLRDQTEMLKQQLDTIQRRIDELQKGN